MFDFFNCLVLFRHSFLPTYFIPLNKWIMLKCPFKDCGDTVRCFSRKTATAEEHWGKADKAAIRHKKAFHLAGEVFFVCFPSSGVVQYVYSAGLAEGRKTWRGRGFAGRSIAHFGKLCERLSPCSECTPFTYDLYVVHLVSYTCIESDSLAI